MQQEEREGLQRELRSRDWVLFCGSAPTLLEYRAFNNWKRGRSRYDKHSDLCLADYMQFLRELDSRDWSLVGSVEPQFDHYAAFVNDRRSRTSAKYEDISGHPPTFEQFMGFTNFIASHNWGAMRCPAPTFDDFMTYLMEKNASPGAWQKQFGREPQFDEYMRFLKAIHGTDGASCDWRKELGRTPRFPEFVLYEDALRGLEPHKRHMPEFSFLSVLRHGNQSKSDARGKDERRKETSARDGMRRSRSLERRRRSPERRRRSPERRQRSPDGRAMSRDRISSSSGGRVRRSPERHSRSDVRQRRSPLRQRSAERQRRSRERDSTRPVKRPRSPSDVHSSRPGGSSADRDALSSRPLSDQRHREDRIGERDRRDNDIDERNMDRERNDVWLGPNEQFPMGDQEFGPRPGMISRDVDDRMRDIDERAFPPNAPLRDGRPMNRGAPSPNIPYSQNEVALSQGYGRNSISPITVSPMMMPPGPFHQQPGVLQQRPIGMPTNITPPMPMATPQNAMMFNPNQPPPSLGPGLFAQNMSTTFIADPGVPGGAQLMLQEQMMQANRLPFGAPNMQFPLGQMANPGFPGPNPRFTSGPMAFQQQRPPIPNPRFPLGTPQLRPNNPPLVPQPRNPGLPIPGGMSEGGNYMSTKLRENMKKQEALKKQLEEKKAQKLKEEASKPSVSSSAGPSAKTAFGHSAATRAVTTSSGAPQQAKVIKQPPNQNNQRKKPKMDVIQQRDGTKIRVPLIMDPNAKAFGVGEVIERPFLCPFNSMTGCMFSQCAIPQHLYRKHISPYVIRANCSGQLGFRMSQIQLFLEDIRDFLKLNTLEDMLKLMQEKELYQFSDPKVKITKEQRLILVEFHKWRKDPMPFDQVDVHRPNTVSAFAYYRNVCNLCTQLSEYDLELLARLHSAKVHFNSNFPVPEKFKHRQIKTRRGKNKFQDPYKDNEFESNAPPSIGFKPVDAILSRKFDEGQMTVKSEHTVVKQEESIDKVATGITATSADKSNRHTEASLNRGQVKSSSNDAYKARQEHERERGEEVATQRKREADIRKIKESAYYTRYRDRWPRDRRPARHPRTPNRSLRVSAAEWQVMIDEWATDLQKFASSDPRGSTRHHNRRSSSPRKRSRSRVRESRGDPRKEKDTSSQNQDGNTIEPYSFFEGFVVVDECLDDSKINPVPNNEEEKALDDGKPKADTAGDNRSDQKIDPNADADKSTAVVTKSAGPASDIVNSSLQPDKTQGCEQASGQQKKKQKFTHREGEFPCPKCEHIFKRSNRRSIHVRLVHENKTTVFTCPFCAQDFIARYNLLKHWGENHKEHMIDRSNIAFTVPEYLNIPECPHCQFTSLDPEILKYHVCNELPENKGSEVIISRPKTNEHDAFFSPTEANVRYEDGKFIIQVQRNRSAKGSGQALNEVKVENEPNKPIVPVCGDDSEPDDLDSSDNPLVIDEGPSPTKQISKEDGEADKDIKNIEDGKIKEEVISNVIVKNEPGIQSKAGVKIELGVKGKADVKSEQDVISKVDVKKEPGVPVKQDNQNRAGTKNEASKKSGTEKKDGSADTPILIDDSAEGESKQKSSVLFPCFKGPNKEQASGMAIKCFVCMGKFSSVDALAKHKALGAKAHAFIYHCYACGMDTRTFDSMSTHMRMEHDTTELEEDDVKRVVAAYHVIPTCNECGFATFLRDLFNRHDCSKLPTDIYPDMTPPGRGAREAIEEMPDEIDTKATTGTTSTPGVLTKADLDSVSSFAELAELKKRKREELERAKELREKTEPKDKERERRRSADSQRSRHRSPGRRSPRRRSRERSPRRKSRERSPRRKSRERTPRRRSRERSPRRRSPARRDLPPRRSPRRSPGRSRRSPIRSRDRSPLRRSPRRSPPRRRSPHRRSPERSNRRSPLRRSPPRRRSKERSMDRRPLERRPRSRSRDRFLDSLPSHSNQVDNDPGSRSALHSSVLQILQGRGAPQLDRDERIGYPQTYANQHSLGARNDINTGSTSILTSKLQNIYGKISRDTSTAAAKPSENRIEPVSDDEMSISSEEDEVYEEEMDLDNDPATACRYCCVELGTCRARQRHEFAAHEVKTEVFRCPTCAFDSSFFVELKQHCGSAHRVKIPVTPSGVRRQVAPYTVINKCSLCAFTSLEANAMKFHLCDRSGAAARK